jgi:hypothetical protein
MSTLTPKAKALLLVHLEDYTTAAKDAAGAEQSAIIAALMLTTIIKSATVDSKATIKTLHSNPTHLSETIVMVNSDI